MEVSRIQAFCLQLPGTTEDTKWGHNQVFSVGGKMYMVISFDEDPPNLSFKTEPLVFEALTHQPGIRPAPYLARARWVALENPDVLPDEALEQHIRESYGLVFAKLTRKARQAIEAEA